MDLYSQIKAIREIKGIKQIEVANTLQLDPSYYARLEKRGNKMSLEQLSKIADVLNVTVCDIIQYDPNSKSQSMSHAVAQAMLEEKMMEVTIDKLRADNGTLLQTLREYQNSRKKINAFVKDKYGDDISDF